VLECRVKDFHLSDRGNYTYVHYTYEGHEEGEVEEVPCYHGPCGCKSADDCKEPPYPKLGPVHLHPPVPQGAELCFNLCLCPAYGYEEGEYEYSCEHEEVEGCEVEDYVTQGYLSKELPSKACYVHHSSPPAS